MTTPIAEFNDAPIPQPPAKTVSRWEDFIDIYASPADVFERRQNQSPWPPILMVSALFILISVATFNSISPLIEAEMRKGFAANPQMTQDQANTAIGFFLKFARWGAIGTPLLMLFAALWYWLIGRVVGGKRSFNAAMVVVAYSFMVDVLGGLIGGAQALLMDTSKMTSHYAISLSAARVLNPDTASPVMLAILGQIDVFNIWYIVLLAIGLRVTAKVSKEQAIAFGLIYWVLKICVALFGVWRQAASAG